jgi:hypothetical protein
MKRAHLHAIFHPAFLHHVFEPPGDAIGEAENEYGLGGRTREVLGAEREDERLSRPGDAAEDAVPFAQAPRDLLLMQVHDGKRTVLTR